ncbi:MAG TPA: glycosyltransferase, partial [Pseudonocardiaceae bacterium]
VFGIAVDQLDQPGVHPAGDLPTGRLHAEMARRRVYVHPPRWTSLGLSLIEAMHLGMPVVGLATTEAVEAVPAEAGVLSTDVGRLVDAVRTLVNEPQWAAQLGKQAREVALARYGLRRFLTDWDHLIEQVIGSSEKGGR